MISVSTIKDGQIQAAISSPIPTTAQTVPVSYTLSYATANFQRACKSTGSLNMTLFNGRLIDSEGRTGYIASNRQMQFDAPPQHGAVYTAGWSVCDGRLTLGASTDFWQCRSGDFYNLYDQLWAAQCEPVHLQAVELVDC